MKKELINLYEIYKNENISLDNILRKSYIKFCEEKSNKEICFDLFRKQYLKSCNINEYEYYTKNVNPSLKIYIENMIFPQYNKNDKAHGLVHIKEVVRRSFALNENLNLNLDKNIIYTIASYHDLGKYIDHNIHEKIAANKFMDDEYIKKFFDNNQRKTIAKAIQDHRSSFEDIPSSNYGKLISSADRNTRIEIVFIRSFYVGQSRTPDMTVEDFLNFTYDRLLKRYSIENPENMFFADETYNNFLNEMRELLKNEVEFKRRYCEVNNLHSIKSKIINEKGKIFN